MGAVLVCFGDQVVDNLTLQRRSRSPIEDSLLERLQNTWSCGHLDVEQEDEDPVNWESFLIQSNRASASSGSRMLSAFYTQVLVEHDDAAFFFDRRGKRVKGSYLDRVEIVDDYFAASGKRHPKLPPPLAALEMYSSSDYEFDTFSPSSTLMSELDNWASDQLPRPAFGRCASSSLCKPVHTDLKAHRARSNPEDARGEPWSSKFATREFPLFKSYLPSGAGALAMAS